MDGGGWWRAIGGLTLVVVAAAVLASCGDDGPHPQLDASQRALFGNPWFIDSVDDGGAAIEVTDPMRASVRWEFLHGGDCGWMPDCPEGPSLEGRDGCNFFGRAITIDATTITLEAGGWSTLAACSGNPLHDALSTLLRGDAFGYSIEGNHLHLSSLPDGVELTFVAPDGPFGPSAGPIILEDAVDGVSYRLVWTGVLQLEVAGADSDEFLSGGGSIGGDHGRINVLRGSLAGGTYLMGTVPPGVARAVYEPSGGAPLELNVLRLTDPDGLVFAEFVDDAPEEWEVVGYDDAGVELHRFGWLAGPATTISSG